MARKPNAADITHGLAMLGGGSKKSGGGGMMKGMEFIYRAGAGRRKSSLLRGIGNLLRLGSGKK